MTATKPLSLNSSALTRRLRKAGISRTYSYAPRNADYVSVGHEGTGMTFGSTAIRWKMDRAEAVLRDAGYAVDRRDSESFIVRLPVGEPTPFVWTWEFAGEVAYVLSHRLGTNNMHAVAETDRSLPTVVIHKGNLWFHVGEHPGSEDDDVRTIMWVEDVSQPGDALNDFHPVLADADGDPAADRSAYLLASQVEQFIRTHTPEA